MTTTLLTSLDKTDMNQYVNERLKILSVYNAAAKYPNIFSWTTWELHAADPEKDYIFEEPFSNQAIKVVFKSYDRTFCDMISCNAYYKGGKDCGTKTAQFWRSGKETILSCQPSCILDDTKKRKENQVDSLFAIYNKHLDKCLYESTGLFSYITDPVTRSDKKWTARVNTVPTGMDFDYNVNAIDESYIDVKLNDEYCQQFYASVNDDGTNCDLPLWREILSYTFIGTSIPELIEMACDNNWGTEPQDLHLKPDKSKFEKWMYEKKEWLKHQRSDYKILKPDCLLSDYGINLGRFERSKFYYHSEEGKILKFQLLPNVVNSIYSDSLLIEERRTIMNKLDLYHQKIKEFVQENDLQHLFKHPLRREFNLSYPKPIALDEMSELHDNLKHKHAIRQIQENLTSKLTIFGSHKTKPNKSVIDNVKKLKKYKAELFLNNSVFSNNRVFDQNSLKADQNSLDDDDDDDFDDSQLWSWLTNIDIGTFLKNLSGILDQSELSLLGMAYGFVVEEKIISEIKSFVLEITTKAMQQNLKVVFTNLSERILSCAVESMTARLAAEFTSELLVKLTLLTAEISSVVLEVIGIINIIGTIFDLALMLGFNPGGLGNELNKAAFDNLVDQVALSKRNANEGHANIEITPDLYARYILEPPSDNRNNNASNDQDDDDAVSGLRDSNSTRPKLYTDNLSFSLSLSSEYLLNRTTNSLGSLFDWKADEVLISDDFVQSKIGPATVYSELVSDSNLFEFVKIYAFRQIAIIALFIVVLLCYFAAIWFKSKALFELASFCVLLMVFIKFETII